MPASGIAIVTPSFARDFALCRELNQSVLEFAPPEVRHYLLVDACDLPLFRQLESARTIVAAIEDVIPRDVRRLPYSRRWWFSRRAAIPLKGWLVQQLVKLAAVDVVAEPVTVNVDSDVFFVRPFETSLFANAERTRLYRLPGGVVAGMPHVKWNRNVARLLRVAPDTLPHADYVGNVISWDRELVRAARRRVEDVCGTAWHVAYARARLVGEQVLYGLHAEKVLGFANAPLWLDERSWCHTYWGPGPLAPEGIDAFVAALPDDDVAASIAGYSETSHEARRTASERLRQRARERTAAH
ncbi:MAG: DUF6492 family protein [Vulcanimicrobiaceae bacterium]